MTVSQFVQQWVQQAAHDLEAARSIRQNGFYDTCVILCQPSVEKYLKALWAHQQAATPPRTHDLAQLAQTLGAPANLVARVRNLSDEYLPARYPDVAGATPYTRYSEVHADRYLQVAEDAQQWVLSQLPSSTP
jgi:HEPN domain-containing protein